MELQTDSSINTLGTRFYSKWETEGMYSVLDWTTNIGIDAFTEKSDCLHS